MRSVQHWVWSALASGETAQDTFEYIIAVALVVVAMFALLFVGMPPIIQMGASAACPAIDTAPATATPTTCVISGTPVTP